MTFTPEDPRAHRNANHTIECGNTSDYCHTCHMTICRERYGGGINPIGYTPLDDVTGWAL